MNVGDRQGLDASKQPTTTTKHQPLKGTSIDFKFLSFSFPVFIYFVILLMHVCEFWIIDNGYD